MTSNKKGKKSIYPPKKVVHKEDSTQILFKDLNYQLLLKKYQVGDWEASLNILDQLLEIYPENNYLIQFQKEINIKFTMHRVNEKNIIIEKRNKIVKISIFITLIIIFFLIIGFGISNSFQYVQNQIKSINFVQDEREFEQYLIAKYEKAKNYIEADRYLDAIPVLLEIQEISPNFLNINEMIIFSNKMIMIEEIYQSANSEFLAGSLKEALNLYKDINEIIDNYKDIRFKIHDLEIDLEIIELHKNVQDFYEFQDWKAVIKNYENILSLDPSFDVEGIKEILFISYLNLIIEIADQADASISEVDQAKEYYRNALALIPQNRNYAQERAELEKTAINLLANKYYFYSLELLTSENYSLDSVEESIRMLEIANNINTDSDSIKNVINNLELFLSGLKNLHNEKIDDAIDDFEQLNQIESDYANGYLQYLLFEAYIIRGDLFFSFAEYSNAMMDYSSAETIAWGNYGNKFQLFNIEIRISSTLKRLMRLKEASDLYYYAFDLIGYDEIMLENNNLDLLNQYQSAIDYMIREDYYNALRLFEKFINDQKIIYQTKSIDAKSGASLYQIAFENNSMIQSIIELNNIGINVILGNDKELTIPVIIEN